MGLEFRFRVYQASLLVGTSGYARKPWPDLRRISQGSALRLVEMSSQMKFRNPLGDEQWERCSFSGQLIAHLPSRALSNSLTWKEARFLAS